MICTVYMYFDLIKREGGREGGKDGKREGGREEGMERERERERERETYPVERTEALWLLVLS